MRAIRVVLFERVVNLVPEHALTHAVDEDDPAQLFALGDVHHAVKVVHLDGELGAVGQTALIVDKFVDVQVHLHVRIAASHAGGLRVLVANLEVFLELLHALLTHFLCEQLGQIRDRVPVALGLRLGIGCSHELVCSHRAVEAIFVCHDHLSPFDADHRGGTDVVQELDALPRLECVHASAFWRTHWHVMPRPW